MDTQPAKNGAIVETAHGRIQGGVNDDVLFFKGVPYGQPPTGDRRWRRAVAPESWTGIRDSVTFCDRAPQINRARREANAWIRDIGPKGENCLALNVYTASVDGKKPVMVYLHGGGFRYGSGGAAGLDGSNLAKDGDVVVVTLNHRLNVFGFANFASFGGEEFADATNLGMLDIVAALEWVRDNIGGFGGDPNNVTIFGQSGGGCKVAVAMTMESAAGLFHKAIMQSSSAHLRLAVMADTERVTGDVLKRLEVADMAALKEMPWEPIFDAYLEAVKANGGNDCFRPTIDGKIVKNNPFDLDATDLAAEVPLMIGTAETEKSFYDIILEEDELSLTNEQLHAKAAAFVGIDDATELVAGYRQGREEESERDIYNRISSDQMYRRNGIEAAERKTAQGGAPAWLYEFTYRIPALSGRLRSPHTMCLPFVFGTTEVAKEFSGAGPEQDALTSAVQGAWVAFAHTGNPNHGGLDVWTPYEAETRPTMVFDKQCRQELDPKPEDRVRITACPPFVTDRMRPMPK
ncbi:MAG TPA: carboxylesterase/lipase family protein [Rhodospirillaceae bacterium]|nr:carboxylesterase/lipase family protein [Rhodospirillaceae bacterium]